MHGTRFCWNLQILYHIICYFVGVSATLHDLHEAVMQGYKVMLQGCNFSMQAIFSQLPLRIFAFCCCTSNYRFHVDLKFKQICKIFYIWILLLGARLSTCHFEYYLGSICFWSPLCTPWINSSSRHALLSSNFLCVISCYYLNIIIRIATCSIVISQGCSDYVFKVKTFVFVAVTRLC